MAMSSQFKFVDLLGSGGFGQVFKASHKLDNTDYAIKRIKIGRQNEDLVKRALLEVQLLARLRHENVVGYNTTWTKHSENLECQSLCQNAPQAELGVTSEQSSSAASLSPLEARDAAKISVLRDSWSLPASFKEKLKLESKDSESSIDSDRIEGSENEVGKDCLIAVADTSTSSVEGASIGDFLYIQMELCKMTLTDFIDQGMNRDEIRTWELFRGIVNGLEYIHGKNIIHRDMKPSNCLIGQDDQIKIGDFGLSCADNLETDAKPVFLRSISRTGGIGTPGYLAPEILDAERPRYTEKVDIYSLGVVLADMMTSSCSECNSLIKDTKHETEPKNCPIWCHRYGEVILLSKLINKNPLKRPTCEEILFIISQVDELKDLNSLGTGTPLRSGLQIKWRITEDEEDVNGLPLQIGAECKLSECVASCRLLFLRKIHMNYTITTYTTLWTAKTSPMQIFSSEAPARIVNMFIEKCEIYIIWKSVSALISKYKLAKYSSAGLMLKNQLITMEKTDRGTGPTGTAGSLVYVTSDCYKRDHKLIYVLHDRRNQIQTFMLKDEKGSDHLLSSYRIITLWDARENTVSRAVTRDFAISPEGNIITVNGTSANFSVNIYNEYGQWEKCIFRHLGSILAPIPRICLDGNGVVYFVYGPTLFIFHGDDYDTELRFLVPGTFADSAHVAIIKSNGDIVLGTPTELTILSNPVWRGETPPSSPGSPLPSADRFLFSPTDDVDENLSA